MEKTLVFIMLKIQGQIIICFCVTQNEDLAHDILLDDIPHTHGAYFGSNGKYY